MASTGTTASVLAPASSIGRWMSSRSSERTSSVIGRGNDVATAVARSNASTSSDMYPRPAWTSAATKVDFPSPLGPGSASAPAGVDTTPACTQNNAVPSTAARVTKPDARTGSASVISTSAGREHRGNAVKWSTSWAASPTGTPSALMQALGRPASGIVAVALNQEPSRFQFSHGGGHLLGQLDSRYPVS